jgi:hypothetical protein
MICGLIYGAHLLLPLPPDEEWGSRVLPVGSGVEIAPPGPAGLTIFLLLADLRSGIGDAAFYEIRLNLELLLRA